MPERIHHLLLFIMKLPVVGEVLPFAASTDPEVVTKRCCSLVRIAMIIHHTGLHISSFLSEYLEINHIAGNGIFYKDYNTINSGNGFAFCTDVLNAYLFKEG